MSGTMAVAGSRPAGLVSIPTSHKPPTSGPVVIAAHHLREAMGAIAPEPKAARIARMRRSVGFAARGHLAERHGFRPDQCFMLTLTYGDGADWRPNHVALLLTHVREWCRRRCLPCRYVWVSELQGRGAVHYHVALFLPAETYLPSADAQGWWPHGSTRTERARAAVPYLMKYLSKGAESGSHKLPGGARMHGAGGLEHSIRRAKRWLSYPAFIRGRADIHDDWRRATGGGWYTPEGECIPGEWERVYIAGWCLRRVADYGRPMGASCGPFSWVHRSPSFNSAEAQLGVTQ